MNQLIGANCGARSRAFPAWIHPELSTYTLIASQWPSATINIAIARYRSIARFRPVPLWVVGSAVARLASEGLDEILADDVVAAGKGAVVM